MGNQRSIETFQWDKAFSREKLLQWAVRQSEVVLFLGGDSPPDAYSAFEYALALAPQSYLRCAVSRGAFEKLEAYQARTADWLFGHLSYDLKNDLESLHSKHPDRIGFQELFFFQPEKLLFKKGDKLEFHYLDPRAIPRDYDAIQRTTPRAEPLQGEAPSLHFTLDKARYVEKVQQLQKQIRQGDFYEINFCLELAGQGVIDPLQTYWELQKQAKAPFSAFYALAHRYALCASPERYLCKRGSELVSQPIKGTAPRDPDERIDACHRAALQGCAKEQAENTMIVDLVRNDLSRVAQDGSVAVASLRAIQSFPHVHHLMSTVTCQLAEAHSWVEALKASFPMGSMTGVPKVSVLKAIEATEHYKRGLYSGALGYCSPERDFDFNVVIRTLLYNARAGQLSHPVGSAITALADAEREYEECALKSAAIQRILGREPVGQAQAYSLVQKL